MFNLVLKDILIQKKSAVFSFIFYPLIAILAFESYSPEAMLIMGSMSIAYILIVNSFVYDERYKCDILIKSLPVNRKDVVYSKYVLLFISSLVGIIIMYVYIFAASFLNINIKTGNASVVKLTFIFLLNTLLYGIQIPFFFKCGYTKMKMMSILIYIFIIMMIAAAGGILTRGRAKDLMYSISNIPSWIMITLFILIMALVVYISSQVSVKIYKNKE